MNLTKTQMVNIVGNLITEIAGLTSAFNSWLSKYQYNMAGKTYRQLGAFGETMTLEFLQSSAFTDVKAKEAVAFSGNLGYTLADFVYKNAGGQDIIGETKVGFNYRPSIKNLTLNQIAAATAILAGNPGTVGSTQYNPARNSTKFVQYDIFEIDAKSFYGNVCVPDCAG